MSNQNQIIAKSYRTGLIIKCGLLFAVGLLLTGLFLFFSAHHPMGPSYQESFARLAQLKHEMLVKSVLIYSLLMILTIAGVVFTTTIYSHRVVGPLVGLLRVIKAIGQGDFTQAAHLRKKDAITSMADSINDMRDSCRQKITNVIRQTEELQTILSSPNAGELGPELAAKAQEIKRTIKN